MWIEDNDRALAFVNHAQAFRGSILAERVSNSHDSSVQIDETSRIELLKNNLT